MIRRLLAVWRHRDDVVAGRARYPGYLLPHLLAAAREPKEPPRADADARAHDDVPAPTVLLPVVRDAGPGAGAAVDVREIADRQPTAAPSTSDRPQVTMEHAGAQDDDDTSNFFAGLKTDNTVTLDPDERAWQEAFRAVEQAIAAEATRGLMRLNRAISKVAPGWREAICGRHDCPRCAADFDEAREMAGVIVLPAEPVDWGTGEWPVLEVTG